MPASQKSLLRLISVLSRAFICCTAIGWTGIGWTGIGWTGIGWTGIGWTGIHSTGAARAQSNAPAVVGEEMRRVQDDFAAGGIRKLDSFWHDCLDEARASQDANTAERCIVYGFAALRINQPQPDDGDNHWARHLTADIIAPGQVEMLRIMGIPPGPREAWLERYRHFVSAAPVEASGRTRPPERDGIEAARVPRGTTPALASDPVTDEPVAMGPDTDLARAAAGKYLREALREHAVADALRQLLGPEMFARLRQYDYGAPMEDAGRFTVGQACQPRLCGVSEARFVFSEQNAWVGIIESGVLRIWGNPPKQAKVLLLHDRTQTAWRGPVQDMSRTAALPPARRPASPVISAVASSAPFTPSMAVPEAQGAMPQRGGAPRMTIAPHYLPVSVDQEVHARPQSGTSEIRLRGEGDTLLVPVLINNVITAPFTIDSGASDVSVSADVMRKLIASGTLTNADFLGKQTYHLADGSRVASETFRIHILRVGDREVRDVIGSVNNDAEGMLLGQSFLNRFRSWSIDNQRKVLLLN